MTSHRPTHIQKDAVALAPQIHLGLPLTKGGGVDVTHRPARKIYSLDAMRPGRRGTITTARGNDPIMYPGDGHLMTIAPTGAGKGVSVIIPNLLLYPGPVVVVDPKGENYAVTARRRREMGHRVVKLDPFGIDRNPEPSDSFNPFDILSFTPSSTSDEARVLADLLMVGEKSFKEPFWDNWARALLAGVILYLANSASVPVRDFATVRSILYGRADDNLFDIVNAGPGIDAEAKQEIETYLGIAADTTRAGVLSTAQQHLSLFGSESVRNSTRSTSFDLQKFIDGAPLSIYIIIPPTKLVSHRALFRLWVGSLLSLVAHRASIPAMSTLFVIDEAAQLGQLALLQLAKTLLRGYGLQAWSFWQDLSQIKQLYETGWATMVNNCAVLQLFGARNYMVSSEFAEFVGADADEIREIEADEQIIVMNSGDPIRARRYNYYKDGFFRDLFDANPLYRNRRPG